VNSPDVVRRGVEAGGATSAEIIGEDAEVPVEAALRIFAGPRRVVLIAAVAYGQVRRVSDIGPVSANALASPRNLWRITPSGLMC
jgi:hypothetical protein